MKTPDDRKQDDRDALQNALASINRDPRQDELHKAATDIRDPQAVNNLRDLVHSDFGKIGENGDKEEASSVLPSAVSNGPETLLPEKVLTADEKASLFAILDGRITYNTKRYIDIQFATVKSALDMADESLLYGLYMMEANGHRIGVKIEVRDGRKGFRFDSCSASSPDGIRDVDYYQAEEIAEKQWGAPLMTREVFELLDDKIITENGTWSHLKTDAKKLEAGLSWYGDADGVGERDAEDLDPHGGFRCSIWVAEAS